MVAPASDYRYKVLAFRGGVSSPFSTVARNNVDTIWPVPVSHEILHNWNETIGTAAVDEMNVQVGFHMGVDIQRIGLLNPVEAARGGEVSAVGPDPNDIDNWFLVIKVKKGAAFEYFQYNHMANMPIPVMGANVIAGDTVGQISDLFFMPDFVSHIHYVITDVMDAALPIHPLSVYALDSDKDPGTSKPKPIDHTGTEVGTRLIRQQGAVPGVYLTYNESNPDITPVEKAIDIIVEVADELGTLPDQVPTKLFYWIEAPPSLPDCTSIDFHDVNSSADPYVLFSWEDALYGDQPSALALSRVITDEAQNHGPSIMVGPDTYPWQNFKNFIITNAETITEVPGMADESEHWRTHAIDDGGPEVSDDANYASAGTTLRASEARFPDGTYTVHVLASDLIHADVDLLFVPPLSPPGFAVRIENFCPNVCSTFPTGLLPAGSGSAPGRVTFSERMDTSIAPSTIISVDMGATIMGGVWAPDERRINFTIDGLTDGVMYTVTVNGTNARDLPFTPGGNALDGNEDGTCGDDAEYEFEVLDCNSSGSCGGEFPECQGDPDCICLERWDGGALCVRPFKGCNEFGSCDPETGICPNDEVCVVHACCDCCGVGTCVLPSSFCGATFTEDRERLPPGTLTLGGVIGEEED